MSSSQNVFRTTGTFNTEQNRTEFGNTNAFRQLGSKKNFFDDNSKNAHYFFDINEDVGPSGAHIFNEYDARQA